MEGDPLPQIPNLPTPCGYTQNKLLLPQIKLTEFSYGKIMGMTPFERKKDESTFILDIIHEAAEIHNRANRKGIKELRKHPAGLQDY